MCVCADISASHAATNLLSVYEERVRGVSEVVSERAREREQERPERAGKARERDSRAARTGLLAVFESNVL